MSALSRAELRRYSRHLVIPEFNIKGQQKLKEARMLVVGAGGLGSPILYYLAAAGTGTIGIADGDLVSESNLQRQILFDMSDIGKPKANRARRKLELLNPHCLFKVHSNRIDRENALDILENYDIVLDASDNFPTRYLINDACVLLKKPLVFGSVYRFEGQVSVFNYCDKNGEPGPNYRDLFPMPPSPELSPDCSDSGVIGALPGMIGSMQAIEAIKIASGTGEPLSGRVHIIDAFSFETRTIRIRKRPENPHITKLVDYEAFCGIDSTTTSTVPEYTADQLHAMRGTEGKSPQLIDVRELHEYNLGHLDATPIPLGDLEKNLHKIDATKKVVIYCRSGQRSARAIRLLQNKHGFTNVYNLKGGLLAWAERIDPDLPVY